MILARHRNGPVLTRDDLPRRGPCADASSVFNPGAVRLGGTTHLLLRVQTRGRLTLLLPARSDTGRRFVCARRPTELRGLDRLAAACGVAVSGLHHVYDPRLTRLDGQLLATTAVDTDRGCRTALWHAAGDSAADHAGLDALDFIAVTGDQDTRNGVLLPRRIDGRYRLLDRPNLARDGGPPTGDAVVLRSSADLRTWQDDGEVFAGRPRYWDELVGAGPPPIETDAGWLLIYHGVATHFRSVNLYQAGAVVLAADDPARVLGRTADNILEPRATWETVGQVPNVVFPTGLTVDGDGPAPREARVRLYYGAADTCVGLATTTVGALLAACGL